jgi:SAM-dependent methyltransferase
VRGEPDAAHLLRAALEAQVGETSRLTHGFHSYPARMHPELARACLAAFSGPGDRVLDPFCGSGTTLIEALVGRREGVGVDLNPLAVRVAEVQSALRSPAALERFAVTVRAVTDASLGRVRARTAVRAPLSATERALYEPHVLLELAGLREEIERVEPEFDRRALQIVFSALVVKFSRQRADTSEQQTEKRIRKGLVSEFFERKARELASRWTELAKAAGARAHVPELHLGDARRLSRILGKARFDLVLCSPPYGGTYDYHAHHARRYPWLGLDASSFERDEVGARRRLSRAEAGAGRWEGEVDACLRSIASVCRQGARVVLLMGDGQIAERRVDAGEQLERLGKRAGLSFVAAAAQQRPDPRGQPRREHLVLWLNRG